MLKPTRKPRLISVMTIAFTTIGVLLGSAQNTWAQESQRVLAEPASPLASTRLKVLEHAFWVCDYVATTRGNSDISTCTAVYEALKDQKFAGDSDALVSWWRQNKVAQHQNIAVAESQNQ